MSGANRFATAVDLPARALVWTARGLAHNRLVLSSIGLLLTLLCGTAYLIVGALQINPLESDMRVRVELAQSGGLLPDQDVTLRGVPIGRVRSIAVSGHEVVVVASIDKEARIPTTSKVQVAALSAAGEQYLNFTPVSDVGPYLSDGAVIRTDQTSTPVTMATMLEGLNGTLTQIDPEKLSSVMKELGVGSGGPDKLAAILDGGMFLVSTLDSVLPQTVSLLHNSKTTLTTLGEAGPSLRSAAANLSETSAGVASMTGGFNELVDNTPAMLASMNAIIAQNSPTMVQLLGNLTTTSQMAYLHIPALQEFFFPQQRAGSTLDAVSSAIRDGGVWAIASVYPRRMCDYDVPRLPGSAPNFPEPYVNAHCTDTDPAMLPRGAANAPRPPGDNTGVLAPGADPRATSDPTPIGPQTIPTPYGGIDILPSGPGR